MLDHKVRWDSGNMHRYSLIVKPRILCQENNLQPVENKELKTNLFKSNTETDSLEPILL